MSETSDGDGEPPDTSSLLEPRPDGGVAETDDALVHCQQCDRGYRTQPVTCDRCGATAFAPRALGPGR